MMLDLHFPYVVTPMRWADVDQVMAIEREAFPLPWPERAYRYELFENENSHYVVLRRAAAGASSGWHWLQRLWQRDHHVPILGYGGLWMVVGEAHISTLAVAAAWRRRGLGELLLWSMLQQAAGLNAFEATLEVRVSNQSAQNLYHKYGFEKVGRRRRYYQDNGEDAWIMTVTHFNDAAYLTRLDHLGQALQRRLWRDLEK